MKLDAKSSTGEHFKVEISNCLDGGKNVFVRITSTASKSRDIFLVFNHVETSTLAHLLKETAAEAKKRANR